MERSFIKPLNLVLILFSFYIMDAQRTDINPQSFSINSLNTAGGMAIGAGGSSTYSLGQLFYEFMDNENNQVLNGVQQGIEFFKSKNTLNINFKVYPNPVQDFLILELENTLIMPNLTYQLISLSGKSILNGSIEKMITRLQLDFLTNGIFILVIHVENRFLKSIKLIKN